MNKQQQEMVREIIKEMLLNEYEQSIVRIGGKTYIVDDEGNEELLDGDPGSHGLVHDGEGAPLERGSYGGFSGRSRGPRYGRGDYDRGDRGGYDRG